MNDDLARIRVVFLGHFASALERACDHFNVVVVGVETVGKGAECAAVAAQRNIPLVTVQRQAEILDIVKSNGAQGILVASFGRILKQPVITLVEWIVNIHPGLLPECGGRHPLPSAILNRHATMGMTAHFIDDERIDHGPVIARREILIDYGSSYRANEARLLAELPFMVDQIAEAVSTGFNKAQRLGERTYFKPLSKDILNAIISAETVGDAPRSDAPINELEETV